MISRMLAACTAVAIAATPALAELPRGAKAPVFTAQGALAGKNMAFNLRSALAKGPVVLYFYPKAFTQGCTLEANAFAEAMDEFEAAGATVIGMSNDDIATLKRFSTEHCRDRFPVAAASPKLIRAYDVSLERDGQKTGLTKRTSYVIAQDGTIAFVHSDMDYRDHVKLTLAAVKRLKSKD
ncbi:MAG: peroxiredoxin [Sphingomonadaceae bacterium]|nr:peroxiredoxin [Sphingomonadaceae bacterium]